MVLPSNLSQANRLLAALPPQERGVFLAQCELVELKPQSVVLAAGQTMAHAWFPVEGFVSQVLPLEEGQTMEIGLIGHEGMFSTALALGADRSAFTCRTQAAGRAFRMARADLQGQLEESAPLRQVLQGYADVRHRQLARQAACLKHHSVEQRLARWLLMARDRAHASELFLTHEALALMLSARRESVTQAARRLLLRGRISYSRGYMMLLDVPALELTACACYRVDQQTYEDWWRSVAADPSGWSVNCGRTTLRAKAQEPGSRGLPAGGQLL
jgi:CRP-like cAMP-binding protein